MNISKTHASDIILSTAHLGGANALSTRNGHGDIGALTEILAAANEAGIRALETADSHGEIGPVLADPSLKHWDVTFTLPSMENLEPDDVAAFVQETVLNAIDRLGCVRLYNVLLNDINDMFGAKEEAVEYATFDLLVETYAGFRGVTFSSSADLGRLPKDYKRGVLRFPFNPLDQHALSHLDASRLAKRKIATQAQSLFLQGLLLMEASERPSYFEPWSPILDRFDARAATLGVSRLALCLGTALAAPEIGKLVIDIESVEHLQKILDALETAPTDADFQDLASNDCALTDSRVWHLQ